MIKIVVYGRCISKDNAKCFGGRNQRYYLDPKYRAYEMDVRSQARGIFSGEPLKGNLAVNLKFFYKNNVRPDLLNAPKGFMDALNKIIWNDDKQIIEAHLFIFIDKQERVELEVFRA